MSCRNVWHPSQLKAVEALRNRVRLIYRVPQFPGLVRVIENGRQQESLCLQPLHQVPDADFVVIHKLLIEADEETYLQKANRRVPPPAAG